MMEDISVLVGTSAVESAIWESGVKVTFRRSPFNS